MIETQVLQSELNYMDAIIHLCEQNQMEVEDVKKFLTPSIVENLESEAMELNFIEKRNMLDI